MGDATGWKRGAKGIDGDCRMPMTHKADYSQMSGDYGQAGGGKGKHINEDEAAITHWGDNAPNVGKNWVTGPVSRGGPPRFAPKGDATTRSPSAAQPSGKYAKKGGKGQRSGA